MKVAQVAVCVFFESNGPSNSVTGLCRALQGNDVEVELHALGVPSIFKSLPSYAYYGYRSTRKFCLPMNVGCSPEMFSGLVSAAQSVDIVHSNGLWAFPNIYPSQAISMVRRNKAGKDQAFPKLVTAPRGCLAKWALRNSWLKKKLFGFFYGQYAALRETDMFHATSEKEYEEIRAAGYRQPVAIVPIGMDLPEIQSHVKENVGRIRKVVFFGRLHKVKGVDRLVRAWGEVACEGWELVIAGPDCGMLEALKGIVAEERVPRVSFVGEINGPAKYEFLAGGDIYVLPSDTENFGVTVTEALVSGTPVIASQGTPWQGLERERCGKWVPIGVEPLAAALKEMMSMSDEERATMGARGREWIRRDFSWKGIGAKMKAAYEWLLAPEKVERPEVVISD